MRAASRLYAARMDLRLGWLRALVALADAGTFTDAAAVLGLSQASVSRAIAGLEREVGVRLGRRASRPAAGVRAGQHPERGAQRRLRRPRGDPPAARRPALRRRRARDRGAVRRRTVGGALARRRGLRVEDLARHTLAIDPRTGTTTPELFGAGARPRAVRETTTIDERLTLIAAGQAVGVTAESTANQYPRPGIAYRVLRGAPPIPVRLAWWRDDPPAGLDELLALARGFWPTAEVTGRGGSPAPG